MDKGQMADNKSRKRTIRRKRRTNQQQEGTDINKVIVPSGSVSNHPRRTPSIQHGFLWGVISLTVSCLVMLFLTNRESCAKTAEHVAEASLMFLSAICGYYFGNSNKQL